MARSAEGAAAAFVSRLGAMPSFPCADVRGSGVGLSRRWFDRALKPSGRSPPPGNLGGMRPCCSPQAASKSHWSPLVSPPAPAQPQGRAIRLPPPASGRTTVPGEPAQGRVCESPSRQNHSRCDAAALQGARCEPRLSTINGVEVGLPGLRDGEAGDPGHRTSVPAKTSPPTN